jgi:HK97 family phage portal protein
VLAMLPFPIYERLPHDGGSEPAPEHPLYDLLHDQTNDVDDAFQWKRAQMFDLIDHGHGYNWIVEGRRGFAHALVPIPPPLVTPLRLYTTLPNGARIAGRELFDVRDPVTGRTSRFTQDEIFHLRGAGGKGILEHARASLGTALATEEYAGAVYGQGMLNGGVIEVPGTMDTEASARMAKTFVSKPGEWHLPKVLEQGVKWTPDTMSPEDAQMLLSRKFGVDDIARWLGVPRQMLENSDPSFGNAEQFDQNFINYSMGGWLALFEFGVNGQLILKPKQYFAQFTRQALVRGNLAARWAAHVASVNAGIVTVDEVRGVEDLNKRGGKADELREPQNITGKPAASDPDGDPAPVPPPPKKQPTAADDKGRNRNRDGQAEAIVVESAARLLRKEIAAVQKAAVKYAADGDAFAAWVTAFYLGHAALVLQTLQLSHADADRYCASQAAQLRGLGGWVAALATWKTEDYAAGLAAMALDEAA